jgi:RNA polymerase sigma factor (sigma-70 family)
MNSHYERDERRPVFHRRHQADWEDLVRRYDPLLRMQLLRCLRRAGLRPEAEPVDDWVQEAYSRLLAGGAPRLRRLWGWSEAQVATYLARVAHGVVLDEKRALAAVKRGGGFHIRQGGRLAELADRAVDPRATPEEETLRRERQRLLFHRCDALVDAKLCPEERRRSVRILRRVFLEGWSGEEIVRAEGGRLAPSTVHALVHRARRRLARYHPPP